MKITIRNETKSDIQAITDITRAAFENCPYGTISLVAVDGERVVGHAAFSPVTVSDGTSGWYGLGPISVLPKLQRQGIGKSLLQEGLSSLKSLGAKGCILVGDPDITNGSASEASLT